MRPHYVVLLVCALLVLSALGPASMAAPEDEEIPNLRLIIDDKEYSVGDKVELTLMLTANGRPVDPDFPGVTVAVLMNFTFGQGGPGDVLWISTVKESKGVFKGNFTIQPWHITAMWPAGEGLPFMGKVVFMLGICSYQGTQAMAMGVVMLEKGPTISVEVSDLYPVPGQEVEIFVRTSQDGVMVDPYQVEVGMSSYDGERMIDMGTLGVVYQSPGVYKASYTVPIDLDTATIYTVRGGASFADYCETAFISPMFDTGFMVNFFDIYMQNVSSTDDMSEIAVWVADPDGNALEGVDVRATVAVHGGSGTTTTDYSNTTGASGMAGFTISHADADRVDVWGNVSDGSVKQNFYMEGVIDHPQAEPPSPDPGELEDFMVEAWEMPEGESIFDNVKYPGDEVTTKFRAFNTSGPLASKRINWYLVDRSNFFDTNYTILESGYVVTDANGDFEVTYELPTNDKNPWLMFEARMWNADDERYERMETSAPLVDSGFFLVDQNIQLSVSRVHKDNPVELRARIPLPDNYFIGNFMAIVDPDAGTITWGQPTSLGPESSDFPIIPLKKMGVNVFGIDRTLPEFFPEDQSLAFLVLSVDMDKFQIRTNFVILPYGGSTTKGVDARIPAQPEPIHAGEEAIFDLVVENTGAGSDTYTIDQTAGPTGWLTFDGEVTMEPSETRALPVTVTVPVDADEGSYAFNLSVASLDPSESKEVAVTVDVLVNGVTVTADVTEMTSGREETVEYVVKVANTGQGNDTYALALSGTAAGWAYLANYTVTVPEGGEDEVVVLVDVPNDADETTYTINLTATSSDGETSDFVVLSLLVQVDGVEVEAAVVDDETWPEEAITLSFEVTNTGQGSDTFDLALEGTGAAWSTLSTTSLELAESGTDTVTVAFNPPSDAAAGFYAVTVKATSANGVTNASATTLVKVWVTGVGISPDSMNKGGYRGDVVTFTLTIENLGEEEDVFTLTHTDPAWAELVSFASNPISIAPGGSGDVDLMVHLPDDIDEDNYILEVTATSSDGRTGFTHGLEVAVTVNGVDATASKDLVRVEKGKSLKVRLTVKNTGQGEDTYTILLKNTGGNWSEADNNMLTLAEGAEGEVVITVTVPKNTKEDSVYLDITVASSDETFTDDARVQVVVEEPEEEGGVGTLVIAGIVLAVAVILIVVLLFTKVLKKD